MTIPSSSSLRSSILRRAFRIAGTVAVASSGTWPQNAALLRSGHCTRPRHTDFGLSLTRVAAPTPATCSPPVAYGLRPVPAPCDRARPCALDTALRCAATASQEPSTSAFPTPPPPHSVSAPWPILSHAHPCGLPMPRGSHVCQNRSGSRRRVRIPATRARCHGA